MVQYRLAVDILHYEVRNAVIRRAAVDETGDIGMLESGENAAFVDEPVDDGMGIQAAPYQLHRDLLVKFAVRPLGQVDRAHAALAKLADNTITSDHAADLGRANYGRGCRHVKLAAAVAVVA